MSKTYDTSEMRRAVSMVRESETSVSGESEKYLSWILEDIPERAAGEAADALKSKVTDFSEQIQLINQKLEETAAILEQFAAALDAADREAAELIRSE